MASHTCFTFHVAEDMWISFQAVPQFLENPSTKQSSPIGLRKRN